MPLFQVASQNQSESIVQPYRKSFGVSQLNQLKDVDSHGGNRRPNLPHGLVNAWNLYKSFKGYFCDYNVIGKERVILFTFCADGHGVREKHGTPVVLCDTFWEAHGGRWALRNQVAVAVFNVSSDSSRSNHWNKVSYSYALAHSGHYDLMIFSDVDTVVRFAEWDMRLFASNNMQEGYNIIMPSSDWDFISTGTIFFRPPASLFFLEWYSESEKYYGKVKTPEHGLGLWSRAQENINLWYESNITQNWHANVPDRLRNKNGLNSMSCSAQMATHEQGCLTHVMMNMSASMRNQLKVIDAKLIHALRWNWNRGKEWIFLHYCCTKYSRRQEALARCITPLHLGVDCTEES